MIRSPYRFFGVLALALVAATTFLLIRAGLHMGQGLSAYLLAINLTTFGFYGYDKAVAGSGMPRVPELLLHTLALLGGSPAALLASYWLRHKTLQFWFRIVLWLIVMLQLGALIVTLTR